MFQKKKPTRLDHEVERALKELNGQKPGTDEYSNILAHLEKLHKMQETPDRVSYDTMVATAANLVGIALIIRHEHVNVITSKAMSFVPKLKS